jgi:SAM-dependent methyltransferase
VTWGEHLSRWWLDEIASDPAYRDEVVPLFLDVLEPEAGARYLDLGCGEGRLMEEVAVRGSRVVGCDRSASLARAARGWGPVVVADLPGLRWAADGSFDGAYVVLVIEHLPDAATLFREAARVVRPGGVLALVANHPVITSPGSGPFVDPDDGEVVWRWGPYLEEGSSEAPAGEHSLTFHHRPLGMLLTVIAGAGWSLERLVEFGVGERRAAGDPLMGVQRHVPRLLAGRWRRGPAGQTS